MITEDSALELRTGLDWSAGALASGTAKVVGLEAMLAVHQAGHLRADVDGGILAFASLAASLSVVESMFTIHSAEDFGTNIA